MNDYWFLLGKATNLAEFEVKTVLGREKLVFSYHRLSNGLLKVSVDKRLDIEQLFGVLGGTVKIAEVKTKVNKKRLVGTLVNLLREQGYKKPVFAINDFSDELVVNEVLKDVKSLYSKPCRFVNLKDPLDSAVSRQKGYVEFIVVSGGNDLQIGIVAGIQDINEWAKRDVGRPAIDPRRGMLPPKVARMMVNSALPLRLSVNTRIYDPFCGSGTVLTEGLFLGVSVIGSDISERAVEDSKRNVEWVQDKFALEGDWTVKKIDATHATREDVGRIAAIVTEPYLGPVDLDSKKVGNVFKGLKKLYIGTLKRLANLLEPPCRLVIVLPQYRQGKVVKNMLELIDTCEKVGYTRFAGPLEYNRPQATIQRQIFILERF